MIEFELTPLQFTQLIEALQEARYAERMTDRDIRIIDNLVSDLVYQEERSDDR